MKGAENMTVSKNPTSLKLSMDVENGTNALGAMQTKSTSVGSVRLDAEAAKCLAVTEAIGELMSHAVVNVSLPKSRTRQSRITPTCKQKSNVKENKHGKNFRTHLHQKRRR